MNCKTFDCFPTIPAVRSNNGTKFANSVGFSLIANYVCKTCQKGPLYPVARWNELCNQKEEFVIQFM